MQRNKLKNSHLRPPKIRVGGNSNLMKVACKESLKKKKKTQKPKYLALQKGRTNYHMSIKAGKFHSFGLLNSRKCLEMPLVTIHHGRLLNIIEPKSINIKRQVIKIIS